MAHCSQEFLGGKEKLIPISSDSWRYRQWLMGMALEELKWMKGTEDLRRTQLSIDMTTKRIPRMMMGERHIGASNCHPMMR